ncbi:hypothetical protein K504DRAFT_134572 [Pleomassaria siparia CBS 279.74]|uniref:Uncharacterized protein n=1 Tax=Pleomassaria siparia CBS 279.74 TaxID=1314801 RepID=A0A6G1KLP2_9PLEO|nr:hypothetical protein K504DRAFT_134572 [Pleomassaria siparia CBS 279.74]
MVEFHHHHCETRHTYFGVVTGDEAPTALRPRPPFHVQSTYFVDSNYILHTSYIAATPPLPAHWEYQRGLASSNSCWGRQLDVGRYSAGCDAFFALLSTYAFTPLRLQALPTTAARPHQTSPHHTPSLSIIHHVSQCAFSTPSPPISLSFQPSAGPPGAVWPERSAATHNVCRKRRRADASKHHVLLRPLPYLSFLNQTPSLSIHRLPGSIAHWPRLTRDRDRGQADAVMTLP